MQRSEGFTKRYKKDRNKDLPPKPPVKLGEPDYDGFQVDVNAGARKKWLQHKYHGSIPVQHGYSRQYAEGYDRIFGPKK